MKTLEQILKDTKKAVAESEKQIALSKKLLEEMHKGTGEVSNPYYYY